VLLSITEFIGRFHPLLVHLPIGILLLALLLQWLSHKEQYRLPHAVLKLIWLCGTFTALLSCITGYLLSLNGEYDVDTVAVHMWMGIAVAAVSLFICAKVFSSQFDVGYKIAIVSLLLLLFGTGHFGGSLTHGSDYLSAAFSSDEDSVSTQQKIIPNIQEATVYADIVQPMLQSKCYSCHGTKKQKGGLRVDDPQLLIKGGKDGEVIFPGKAEESELVKRLLLAREDEDHMPPKGKPQLNESQIALLHWWIEQGADFTKKVKEIPQPEKIKPMLAALQGPAKEKTISTIPEFPVEPADEKALKILRDRGVVIMPVAQNSNYLMANFVTAININDADLKLLLPLKKQLVWLKLGNTKISDSGMFVIGQCSNIILLQLNHTNITDKGIVYLKPLNKLQSLNLVGTKVTANGLLSLQSLKKLTSVFLYQTNIHATDWRVLKNAFPKTMLDTGGYKVPFLPTDTLLVKPKKS
jgi:mono/diheme cytochrome c family protein/uncharacterized membrane protein